MGRKSISTRYGSMGLVRNIAVRLGRFHKWNCPCSDDQYGGDREWIGKYGEMAAASWCKANGRRILRSNWKYGQSGEIDLVCRDGGCLVFIEVKTRTSKAFGDPARAVDQSKRQLVRSGAHAWLRMLDDHTIPYRYDIIEVVLNSGAAPEINCIPYAFGERERNARKSEG